METPLDKNHKRYMADILYKWVIDPNSIKEKARDVLDFGLKKKLVSVPLGYLKDSSILRVGAINNHARANYRKLTSTKSIDERIRSAKNAIVLRSAWQLRFYGVNIQSPLNDGMDAVFAIHKIDAEESFIDLNLNGEFNDVLTIPDYFYELKHIVRLLGIQEKIKLVSRNEFYYTAIEAI